MKNEHELTQLNAIIKDCRETFRLYAQHHQARFDRSGGNNSDHLDKANTNERMVAACDRALGHLKTIRDRG